MTPTSKLEAVNIMLSRIGEAPVNSLTSGLEDAELAETILLATSREVQSKGWVFNTDLDYSLTPDATTKHINLPSNTLKVDTRATIRKSATDVVERGRRLYDRSTHTYEFTDNVKVDLVTQLDFNDLPEPARRYITLKSARVFQDAVLGSESLHRFQQEDEKTAWIELQDYQADTGDFNIFDSYDVAETILRDFQYITSDSSSIANTT